MWWMTRFGFFSVVRKPGEPVLTVRARTRGDLDRLRLHYLPELGEAISKTGTDYPWRAQVAATALGEAMRRAVADVDYPKFRDEVTHSLGAPRSARYTKVWQSLHGLPEDLPETVQRGHEGLPWPVAVPPAKKLAYGGVVLDGRGRLLLREVANQFGGYVWSFAKGRPEPAESPRDTALREVREELGVTAALLVPLPGEFIGGTTVNRYFLMRVDAAEVDLDFQAEETSRLCWATPEQARNLLAMTHHATGRQRDLTVLGVAQACLQLPDGQGTAADAPMLLAGRHSWRSRPMPAARRGLMLSHSFPARQVAALLRGKVPMGPQDPWFVFMEDGVLHLHRADTGVCVWRLQLQPDTNGQWHATRLLANAHPAEHRPQAPAAETAALMAVVQALFPV